MTDQEKAAQEKTTKDEGKTFDKDTVFVCVRDCYQNNVRYRKGITVIGRKCPAHFVVAPTPPPAEPSGDK